MDFGALPPEVNSGRMYIGPGPETLLAASAGWEGLAAELHGAEVLHVDSDYDLIAEVTGQLMRRLLDPGHV